MPSVTSADPIICGTGANRTISDFPSASDVEVGCFGPEPGWGMVTSNVRLLSRELLLSEHATYSTAGGPG